RCTKITRLERSMYVDQALTNYVCYTTNMTHNYTSSDDRQVKASQGSISTTLERLSVPPGIVLAGRVVADRAAHWTSDYDLTTLPHERRVELGMEAACME